MSSYEVAGHFVDHPPLFACRKHKSILKLGRAFVEEILAYAPDLAPQNLTDVAAAALGGDDQAFRTSDYLIPPKVLIFNPRKIEGRGALPFAIVFINKRFFGIPASYLRRRAFDGCAECAAENDPASDASFPDYRPPAAKPAPAATPPKGSPTPGPARPTRSVPKPPGDAPVPQRPTRSVPKPPAPPPP